MTVADSPRTPLGVELVPRGLRRSLVFSVVLHVGVAVGLVVATTGSFRARQRTETVMTAKLVRLGRERPKEFLPRKEEPLPSAPKPAPVEASPQSKAGKPVAGKDPTAEKRSFSDALSRLKKSSAEAPEGHADGVVDGEVSSLAESLIGNRYVTEIYKCVKDRYAIEGIPPERIRGKSATVFLRVLADGTFFDVKVEKLAGVAAFDRAVDKAIRRCGKVSPPPKEILDRIRTDGIEFEFKP